jgi:hypothetical protein
LGIAVVEYQDEQLFPFPRDRVWKLLQDHVDDSLILKIHPLIKRQTTVSRSEEGAVVERVIDARGKPLVSQWRYTVRAPDYLKWEILSGTGPYAPGSVMENTYSEEAGGTRIRSKGRFKVTVAPFFVPQRAVLNRVFDTIDNEDRRWLRT